jgi:hypothetical protein
MERQFIVKIESFEGDDTYVRCGDDKQDYLFCVISIGDDGNAEIVDSGYRSFDEAAVAWPDVVGGSGKPKAAPHRQQ